MNPFDKKYKAIKKIGHGYNTEVYKVQNINTKELRAIKTINLEYIRKDLDICETLDIGNEFSEEEIKTIDSQGKDLKDAFYDKYIKRIREEVKIMKICSENNENSVKYYETFENEEKFSIVMELCDETLTQFKKSRTFNSKEIYEILSQLNNTFEIMIKEDIVHRNLKPDNILIKKLKDDKYIIKLSDYCISKIGQCTELTEHVGTTQYMAPEIIEGKEYNHKCDLWSLGIIIYELCFKERPYKGVNEYVLLQDIQKFGKKRIKKTGDEQLDDLISKLLVSDPKERITWNDYFNHPFFKNYITIIYKINKNENNNKIKIFGENFVQNNKDKCYIIYEEKDYPLTEYFEVENNEELLELKLFGTKNITDMSYMFSICHSLESLPDISELNTTNVTNMNHLFCNCNSLESLPDISNWNTNNVTNMSHMFLNCYSLKSLPDISKWETNNVTDMSFMFSCCEALESLPDISKWNTDKVTNMNFMFFNCNRLKSFPDLKYWNITNVTNMLNIFSGITCPNNNLSHFNQ